MSDHEKNDSDLIEIKEHETTFSFEIKESQESLIKKYKFQKRLTPEILINHFHMTKKEACEALHVCNRTINYILREYNMCNWPYRSIKQSEQNILKFETILSYDKNDFNQKKYKHQLKEEKKKLFFLKQGKNYKIKPFNPFEEYEISSSSEGEYSLKISDDEKKVIEPLKTDSIRSIFFSIQSLLPSFQTQALTEFEEELGIFKLHYLKYLRTE